MRTHSLETASGETCQDTETNRPSNAHSLSGDGIGRNSSRHGNKLTERRVLTNWRRNWERLVRARQETGPATCTHDLETASGWTCQDTETNQASDAHSLPGDGIGRGLSGRRNKPIEQRAHTLKMASGETCQDTETNRSSNTNSLPGDGIGRDLSGHGNKPTERRALTSWRRNRERGRLV